MKLQVGVLYRDRQLAGGEDVAALLGPWATRQAETAGALLAGPVALAYRGDQITPEDAFDVQPLADGPYRLTWDGRLDNRTAIARRARVRASPETPDAALVVAAYAAVGPAIVGELLGEFALALYDTRTRELCLARSMCGARPLYYTESKGERTATPALRWASDFAHLVRVSGVELVVNEAYVLGHLVLHPRAEHTALRDVRAVPPNRALWFDATTGQLRRSEVLWDPMHVSPVAYRSDAEYEARCRELITEAVRVRLRATHPVFAELSGGFDSSTVVTTADQLRHSRNEASEGVQTLSGYCEDSWTGDERPFIRAVEAQRGVPTCWVSEREQHYTLGLEAVPPFTGPPNQLHLCPGRYARFAALMRAHGGSRVLLTGQGGDFLFWSAPDGAAVVADALAAGQLGEAHRVCRAWSRVSGVPYHRLLLWQAVPAVLAARDPTRWSYVRLETPGWLGPALRPGVRSLVRDQRHDQHHEHTEREASASRGAARRRRLTPSLYARGLMVELMVRGTGAGYYSEYETLAGPYVSHPYTHRPLVEFCLGVPMTQHVREGQFRSLMRRALGDRLPPRILTRVSKGSLDEAFVRAVQRDWAQIGDVKRWQVCERGFVDPTALAGALRQMRLGFLGSARAGYEANIFRVFSLERWLRSLASVHADHVHTDRVHTDRVHADGCVGGVPTAV